MLFLKKYRLLRLLLLAFIGLYSTHTFAFSEEDILSKEQLSSHSLQKRAINTLFLAIEINEAEPVDISLDQDLDFFSSVTPETYNSQCLRFFSVSNNRFAHTDKRDLLKNQIFPFHFFW